MHISPSSFRVFFRNAVIAACTGSAALGSNAQQTTPTSVSPVRLQVEPAAATTLMAANARAETIGYSSSAGLPETEAATNFLGATGVNAAMQPPPRRYGRRPVYADSRHNADGSNKYTFFAGGGVSLPTGGTHNYLSTGYSLQGGGGRNFNKRLAVLAQFDYNHYGIQSSTLNSLLGTYVSLGATGSNGGSLGQLGGNNHIWSFTLDPMYTYMDQDKVGGYVIGGIGFYHKVTDFTTPAIGQYCDYYYGCYTYQANQTIDSYVSNAAGYNAGLGFTYKGSRFSDLKFYAEARYVYISNSRRPYFDGTNGTSLSATYFNVFPQNSAPTTYIPITFGIRF